MAATDVLEKSAETEISAPPPVAAAPVEEGPPPPEEVCTREIVTAILKDYNSSLSLLEYEAELGSKVGDNYMSIMYAAKIYYQDPSKPQIKGKSDENRLDIMLKTMPKNAMRIQMINEGEFFTKEINMYSQVFRDFYDFQKGKGIAEGEIFQKYPKCFKTFHDSKNDYLALEDLRREGYKLGNRFIGNDFEGSTLVLSNLAKFHAISYAMFEGDYDKQLAKYPFLAEKMFKAEKDMPDMNKQFFLGTFKMEADILRSAGLEKEATILEKILEDDYINRMYEITGKKVKNAVITHGDCWTNNFLFHFDEHDKADNLKFLDFQISRCGSKTLDIGYFMHTSVQMDILNNREEDCLAVYFNSFVDFCVKLGVDPKSNPVVFSWEHFLKEYDNFRMYGVSMGLLLAPMLSATPDLVPDMENISEDLMNDPDAAKKFMGNMMTSDAALQKYKNLAGKHASRIKSYEPLE